MQNIEIPPWNVLNTIYSSFSLQQYIQSHTPIHDDSACIKGSDGPGISFSQFDSYTSLTDAAALWTDFPVTRIDKKTQRRLWINKLQERHVGFNASHCLHGDQSEQQMARGTHGA